MLAQFAVGKIVSRRAKPVSARAALAKILAKKTSRRPEKRVFRILGNGASAAAATACLTSPPRSDTFKVETGARRLVAAWRIGKTVQFRCGPAAVTGDETLTKPLRQTADASSRQRGKARVEDDPEARRPARFSVDVVSLEDKGPLVFRRHRFPKSRPALGGRLAKPLRHSSARPIGIARASSLAMRGLPCLTPGLAGAASR